jgi:Protein of unknown function (DUF2950)
VKPISLLTTATRLAFTCAAAFALVSCSRTPTPPSDKIFASPEEAARALTAAAKTGKVEAVVALFGADAQAIVDSSDPASARRNIQVFKVAAAERWQLVDQGTDSKLLVVGNEGWPFPIPLVKDSRGWRFDTAAGKEEILARRVGRNELAAIRISRTYVAAQQIYAERGHDGKPAGLYAATFRSDEGRENGLYWPASAGRKRSPLGDLMARAAAEGRAPAADSAQPSPFHGYYFRILTAQGAAADGGAKTYLTNGNMSGGFALVAWPAQYDVTGVMTFVVNQDGTVREKDLGPGTDAAARAMTLYDPDKSWEAVR